MISRPYPFQGGLWGLGAHPHPQGRCKRLRWPVEKKNLRSPCGRGVWQCDSRNLLHPRPVQAFAVACGVLGRTPTPKAGANACGGLWRRKTCDRRVAAGFGNAIREIYYTHGRCKRLRWPVRFAEERDAGMGGPKVNLTFNPLAKLHPVVWCWRGLNTTAKPGCARYALRKECPRRSPRCKF